MTAKCIMMPWHRLNTVLASACPVYQFILYLCQYSHIENAILACIVTVQELCWFVMVSVLLCIILVCNDVLASVYE